MPDQPDTPGAEENFAELLDAFSPGKRAEVRVGDRVKGRVISVGKDTIFVDAGMKIDAVVERAELLDAQGNLPCSEGDELELYVAAVSENEIRLSRAISGAGGAQMLRDAYKGGVPVEGKVKETCKGGYTVEVLQRRAFCPQSQIDLAPTEDAAVHIGQTYQFLLTRFEEKGRNIVVSRRELLNRELDVLRKQFMETLKVGDVLDGKVARIMPFGAFVAIGPGVEGMIHVSEISWSKTAAPGDVLSPGDRMRVKVIGIDNPEGARQPKIGLSIKQLEVDPWLSVDQQVKDGDVVRGKVTRCMPFGAFVEIAPGIEGMVHVSEMSYTRRVNKPEEVVKPGDAVTAVVKSVDPDKKRIALSMRDAEGDPWAEVLERFPMGKRVEGVLEKKEKFGYFVRLAPGITGLLPLGNIRRSGAASEIEKTKEGETLLVAVEEVNVQRRRISLAASSSEDEGEWQRFAGKPQGSSSLGSLAEQLQKALRAKEGKK